MNLILTIVMGLLTVVNAVLVLYVKSFTSSYASEKGKNLATKEDLEVFFKKAFQEESGRKKAEITAIQEQLDTVVAQNDRIVKSSEEIKSKISERQRLWELKRETALDIMRAGGKLREKLLKLYIIASHAPQAEKTIGFTKINVWADDKDKAVWNDTVEAYRSDETVVWQLQQIAALAFSPTVCEQLERVRDTHSKMVVEIYSNPNTYLKREKDLKHEEDKLAQVIRDDLGLSKSPERP